MLKGTTTPDAVAEILRQDIMAGRVGPGEALRQQDLAARFGVSRIPIREALRQLESDGLVSVYPNRGAFVVTLGADEVAEIMDMRLLLEADLLRRSVPRMSDEDVSRIAEAAVANERTAGSADWVTTDRAFHEALYLPAQRPRQMRIVFALRRDIERHARLHADLPIRREQWLNDHRLIVEACQARDAEAAATALMVHIAGTGDFLGG